jgi:hypothetical protein
VVKETLDYQPSRLKRLQSPVIREWRLLTAATAGGLSAAGILLNALAPNEDSSLEPVMGVIPILFTAFLIWGGWAVAALEIRARVGWARFRNCSSSPVKFALLVVAGALPIGVEACEYARNGWAMQSVKLASDIRVIIAGWAVSVLVASVLVLTPLRVTKATI